MMDTQSEPEAVAVADMTPEDQNMQDDLRAAVTPIKPHDTMAEAGRKILLVDFMKMLENEDGSRVGDDIEHVHNMRVATRRMRSAFRLLEPYYKTKPVRPFIDHLRTLARQLGKVRDLDVMIQDLQKFQAKQEPDAALLLQLAVDSLDERRAKARKKLIALLDSKEHAGFIAAFRVFLTHQGRGARPMLEGTVMPHQVRHVLPALLHDHLASVRAYDAVITSGTATPTMLHGLRIEFKRLRYAAAFFSGVLGASGEQFITELKTIQDHLGRLNDIVTAQEVLQGLQEDEVVGSDALAAYLDTLRTERDGLEAGFVEVWERFNTRTVQSKLSNALLSLR